MGGTAGNRDHLEIYRSELTGIEVFLSLLRASQSPQPNIQVLELKIRREDPVILVQVVMGDSMKTWYSESYILLTESHASWVYDCC